MNIANDQEVMKIFKILCIWFRITNANEILLFTLETIEIYRLGVGDA